MRGIHRWIPWQFSAQMANNVEMFPWHKINMLLAPMLHYCLVVRRVIFHNHVLWIGTDVSYVATGVWEQWLYWKSQPTLLFSVCTVVPRINHWRIIFLLSGYEWTVCWYGLKTGTRWVTNFQLLWRKCAFIISTMHPDKNWRSICLNLVSWPGLRLTTSLTQLELVIQMLWYMTYEECCTRSGYQGRGQIITSADIVGCNYLFLPLIP